MPRPQKCRRICAKPRYRSFLPENCKDADTVVLSMDEFEVIRLVDYEKKTHEQCAKQMDISRTTVTEIYENARYKIAKSFVEGKCVVISGGNYRICDGSAQNGCGRMCDRECEQIPSEEIIEKKKGDNIMRIAVTYENGQIFQHFGHTEQFKIYDCEGNKIVNSIVVNTNGTGHGALAGFLAFSGANALICGGIGGGARNALAEAGIILYGGCSGDADEAVQALLDGNLDYNPNVMCDHHDHGEAHTCGEHGCGEHEHHCAHHDDNHDCGCH